MQRNYLALPTEKDVLSLIMMAGVSRLTEGMERNIIRRHTSTIMSMSKDIVACTILSWQAEQVSMAPHGDMLMAGVKRNEWTRDAVDAWNKVLKKPNYKDNIIDDNKL